MSSFSPVTLQPGVDNSTLVQAINDNFRQIASTNRTNIITDENGDARIIIGKMPNGKYGIIISNEGDDVKDVFVQSP